MPDIFKLVSKWWKQMFALVIVSLVVAGIIVFIQPSRYLSTATSVPSNAASFDKDRIYSENIEGLYSNIGSPDDLDMMLGTAQLDTVYLFVTDQFNLYDHYKIGKGDDQRLKAARLLEKYSRVIKSDYGELQVKVWDTDKNLAPQLANAITDKLSAIHTELQSLHNKATLSSLAIQQQKLQIRIDSIGNFLASTENTEKSAALWNSRSAMLTEQFKKNEAIAGEYRMMLENKPPVLLPVEKARPALRPDTPRIIEILAVTAFISLLFSFLLALLLEKRKPQV